MIVMPYYLLPLIPIVFAPIFISLSDLRPKQKLFYSLYPLTLFLLVYVLFHHQTSKPRTITFEAKGWYTIIYDVQDEIKLLNNDGYREVNFTTEPVLLTATKQMDVIPISESRYFYKDHKDQTPKKILYNSDIQYKENNQDTSLYIYYEFPELDSIYCFYQQIESNPMETFFIGTIADYFYRDSIYPISKRNNRQNNFFKTYCENEKNKIGNQ